MTIKTSASINFSDLLNGDVFRYDNRYFMKCGSISCVYEGEEEYNSVCIEDGELEYFEPTKMIEKISGIFVINS